MGARYTVLFHPAVGFIGRRRREMNGEGLQDRRRVEVAAALVFG
jgi:hypothetical protein